MYLFDVTVPFVSMRFERIGFVNQSHLPDSFELDDNTFRFDSERDLYLSELSVKAPDSSAAKKKAVEKVRFILAIFAVSGDAFRIVFGQELKATRRDPHSELGISGTFVENIAAASGVDHVVVTDVVRVGSETSYEQVKKRSSVEFERCALSSHEHWPIWFRTMLELNYLATVSHEVRPAFVIRYAALELMVKAKAGSPKSIVKARLAGDSIAGFERKIKQVLCE